jgi:phosphomannomutase
MAEKAVIHEVKPEDFHNIDTIKLYEDFLKKRGTLDFGRIRRFIKEEDCFLCIDHIHAPRGEGPELLGESLRYSIYGRKITISLEVYHPNLQQKI